jgi:hypothetical protein
MTKKRLGLSIITLLIFIISIASVAADVKINEFLTKPWDIDWNYDGNNDFDDQWIELYNNGSTTVNLTGWKIIIDYDGEYNFPTNTLIETHGFLTIYDFDLDRNDGNITLRNKSNDDVENVIYSFSPEDDYSYGRINETSSSYQLFSYPTPNGPNGNCTFLRDDEKIVRDTILCDYTYEINDSNYYSVIEFTDDSLELDCNGAEIIGNNSGTGIEVDSFEEIIIKNCNISNYEIGIDFYDVDQAKIRNTFLSNNNKGILLNAPYTNTNFIYNTVFDSNNYGIYSLDSYDEIIDSEFKDSNNLDFFLNYKSGLYMINTTYNESKIILNNSEGDIGETHYYYSAEVQYGWHFDVLVNDSISNLIEDAEVEYDYALIPKESELTNSSGLIEKDNGIEYTLYNYTMINGTTKQNLPYSFTINKSGFQIFGVTLSNVTTILVLSVKL